MKPIILLFLFVFFLISKLSAQEVTHPLHRANFSKGNWQGGLRDGYQGGVLIGNRNTLQLQAGYYLAKQLAVGISSTWAREGGRYAAFHDITVGPYVRYQFTATRLSPFVDLSYQVGRRISGDENAFTFSSLDIQSAQISPGVSIGVASFLRAELSYHFQWIYIPTQTVFIGQPQFGITWLLNRK